MTDSEDKIFKNGPVYMKNLLGKTVKITTTDKREHSGVIYVVDPIFKTVILHTNWINENEYDTVLILYHAIRSLEVISEEIKRNYLEGTPVSEPETGQRKRTVKKWLKHMMIEAKESGDYLKIEDYLVILPPYNADNCICNNVIILERIQKILEMMPDDFS